ncbi:MAG: hypothetical protein JO334_09210 [Verrucomicrobia bacterium]|nr:hypothetical protein [Verrucomicrobiota bacterium]
MTLTCRIPDLAESFIPIRTDTGSVDLDWDGNVALFQRDANFTLIAKGV